MEEASREEVDVKGGTEEDPETSTEASWTGQGGGEAGRNMQVKAGIETGRQQTRRSKARMAEGE
jgi:hypothetical protein